MLEQVRSIFKSVIRELNKGSASLPKPKPGAANAANHADMLPSIVSESRSHFLHHSIIPIYLTFPEALLGAPFAPCLLTILPACPLAAPAALFAFSCFFLLSAVAFFSFPALMASWRAAARASGRCDRRSLITSREAPTIPRCCLTVRRVRFLATSCYREDGCQR